MPVGGLSDLPTKLRGLLYPDILMLVDHVQPGIRHHQFGAHHIGDQATACAFLPDQAGMRVGSSGLATLQQEFRLLQLGSNRMVFEAAALKKLQSLSECINRLLYLPAGPKRSRVRDKP